MPQQPTMAKPTLKQIPGELCTSQVSPRRFARFGNLSAMPLLGILNHQLRPGSTSTSSTHSLTVGFESLKAEQA